MDQLTDDNLVTAAQTGDKAAYAVLLRRHYQQVFLTCLAVVGSPHDAEDMAQDAFITGFAKIQQLREASQFAAWMGRIARNHSINLLQKINPVKTALVSSSHHRTGPIRAGSYRAGPVPGDCR